jgi:ABC-type multidrug transport system ATPase subunit
VTTSQTTEDRTDTEPPVLSAEGLGHSFGDVDVLEDASIAVPAGTVTAVVGANGSGKSTLLRILAGLVGPDSGTVTVDAEGPRPVGYLPQSPSFRSAFSVAETLSFYADLLPGDVDVEAALETVGLVDVADRRVDALSGGMRRLLGIAQATLGDPAVALLDEPTGDLDPRMTRRVFDTVDRLAEDGTTVLLATHNLAGAADADRVLVLDGGAVAAEGSPEELVAASDGETLTDAFVHFVGDEGAASVRSGLDVGVASGTEAAGNGTETDGDAATNGGDRR